MLIQTAEKILGFKELLIGWHYGEGDSPSAETVQQALRLNSELISAGFSKTNAFPGVEGEIQVTAYAGTLYLEFTIETDGEITFIYERDGEEIGWIENLDVEDAIKTIHKFRQVKESRMKDFLWWLAVALVFIIGVAVIVILLTF